MLQTNRTAQRPLTQNTGVSASTTTNTTRAPLGANTTRVPLSTNTTQNLFNSLLTPNALGGGASSNNTMSMLISLITRLIQQTQSGGTPAHAGSPADCPPPVVTNPTVTAPVVTNPTVTAPVVTNPTVTAPVVTAPVVTAPALAPTPAPTNAPLQSGKNNPVSPLPGFEKPASPNGTTSTHESHQPPASTGIKFLGTDVWKSSATWNGITGYLNIVNVGGDPARGQGVNGQRDVVAIDATAFPDKNDRIWYTEDGRRILPDANGTIWVTPGQCLYNFRPDLTTVAQYSATTYTQTLGNTGTVIDQDDTGTTAAATPLVLDLNGDGVQTLDVKNGVKFDLNNTGSKLQTGWVDAKDGLLVRDLDGNGSIDNGSELFGSSTRLANGSVARDGFQALAQFDSNGDKSIDASDKVFGELKVWQDINSDGISQANELKSLNDAGVRSVGLGNTTTPVVQNGNTMGLQGSFVDTKGKSHDVIDVWFATQS